MNKGLIDLSRANPPATTLPEPAPEKAKPPSVSASSNLDLAKPVPTVVPTERTSEPVSTIAARIPESLHQAVRMYCTANRIEVQRFVEDALTACLARLQS